jgi:tRNA (guanine26-N2/guanine27-N2)-dimethyltransferase
LLTACYLAEDFYDLIDLDMFGSDSTLIGPALDAVRFGGLLYLTSTDGFSSSGKGPLHALATYGAYTRAHPSANEQGLRILIGAAVREAAKRRLRVEPLFSLYSAHGPVFRVMLRVMRSRGKPLQKYGFVGYSHVNGSMRTIEFKCGHKLCLLTAIQGLKSYPISAPLA